MIRTVINRLSESLDQKLESVVLYGSHPRGDGQNGDLHLLIVLSDLELETLSGCREAVLWWLRRDQPWPRILSRQLIHESLDVFPLEHFELLQHRRILYGDDPVPESEISRAALRSQCERELRERFMRLTEGYLEARGRKRLLSELLAASYASFLTVFRGCLHLLGTPVPERDSDVARDLCRELALDRAVFIDIESLENGVTWNDLDGLFARFYQAIKEVIAQVDRFGEGREVETL